MKPNQKKGLDVTGKVASRAEAWVETPLRRSGDGTKRGRLPRGGVG